MGFEFTNIRTTTAKLSCLERPSTLQNVKTRSNCPSYKVPVFTLFLSYQENFILIIEPLLRDHLSHHFFFAPIVTSSYRFDYRENLLILVEK
jgi:hypothetical protein